LLLGQSGNAAEKSKDGDRGSELLHGDSPRILFCLSKRDLAAKAKG
jgi:hypothetical protein